MRIKADEKIILMLLTTARIVPSYNLDSEMEENTVTTEMDWEQQEAFHASCCVMIAQGMLDHFKD